MPETAGFHFDFLPGRWPFFVEGHSCIVVINPIHFSKYSSPDEVTYAGRWHRRYFQKSRALKLVHAKCPQP